MCHPRGKQRLHGLSECDCFCGPGLGIFLRRYMSSEEEQEKLEAYKDQLEKELEGVEERIKELDKK